MTVRHVRAGERGTCQLRRVDPAGVTGDVRLKITYATTSGDLVSYTATKVIPADTGPVPL